MLSFFRRASNSKIGTWIVGAIGLAILAGFAMATIRPDDKKLRIGNGLTDRVGTAVYLADCLDGGGTLPLP